MSEKNNIDRIVSLDWLRGLCAISIMFYLFFFMGVDDPTSVFHKLGVYGVSTFFILSGLSMAIVYNGRIKSKEDSIIFFSRRLFRIIPLYSLACVMTILLSGWTKFSIGSILINITTIFGFIDSSFAIPMGGWSIGNEMVFYLFTPLILFLYDKKKLYGNLLLFVFIGIGIYFSFILLNPNLPLSTPSQWQLYVHPLNNFFLFFIGIGLYYNFDSILINPKINLALLGFSLLCFVIYPYENQIGIVSNLNRFIFVFIITIWVFSFYKMKISNISSIGRLFEKFGIATYGVYILHPICGQIISYFFKKIFNMDPSFFTYLLSAIVTIVVALISYYYFESKVSMWGKKFTKKYIQ